MLCLNCRKEVVRRKNGACPHCGEEIRKYKAVWIPTGEKSPVIKLLRIFERNVTQIINTNVDPLRSINYTIPRKGGVWETAIVASYQMLNEIGFDIRVAEKAMEILRTNKRLFPGGFPASLSLVRYNWPLATTAARKMIEQEEERIEQSDTVVSRLERKEDIF